MFYAVPKQIVFDLHPDFIEDNVRLDLRTDNLFKRHFINHGSVYIFIDLNLSGISKKSIFDLFLTYTLLHSDALFLQHARIQQINWCFPLN